MDSSPLDLSWRASFSRRPQHENNGKIQQKVIGIFSPWNLMNMWKKRAESVNQRQAFAGKQVTPGHWQWNGNIISPTLFQCEQTAEIISFCSIPSNDALSPWPATWVPAADYCRREYLCPLETAWWGEQDACSQQDTCSRIAEGLFWEDGPSHCFWKGGLGVWKNFSCQSW